MRLSRRFACAVLALAAAAPALPAQQVPPPTDAFVERGPRFLLATEHGRAQRVDAERTPILRQRIALDLVDVRLDDALETIAHEAGMRLVFSGTTLDLTRRVHFRADSISVAAALTEVLLDARVDVLFARSGRQAVLVQRPVPRAPRATGAIAGSVTDAKTHEPIPAVSVQVDGTTLGALTGSDGTYRIATVPPGSHTVSVRRIGYAQASQPVTVPDSGDVTLDFALERSASALEQVVVTGTAGSAERRTQPAAIASVDAAAITASAPVNNVTEVLQSRTAGVSIVQSSGSVGSAPKIRIRGGVSLSLSNEPLVFIDGVRVDSRAETPLFAGNQGTSALNDLNPDDIERIEVVKGPAASTLYGADASAGVIQIITKRGRVGAGAFTQRIAAEYDVTDAHWTPPDNFALCGASDVLPASPSLLCRGKAAGTVVRDNPILREHVFGRGAVRSLDWSGRGGGDNYGYFGALGIDNEDGTLPNNGFDRYSGRINFTFLPTRSVTIDAGLSLGRTKTTLPQNGDAANGYLAGAMLGSPVTVGDVNNGWLFPNLNRTTISQIEYENAETRTTPTLTITHTPTSWFKHRLTLGGDLSRGAAVKFYPKNSDGRYIADPGLPSPNAGQVQESRTNLDLYTIDYLGTFTRTFGARDRYTSELAVGGQWIDNTTATLGAVGTGLVTDAARSVSAASLISASEGYARVKQLGYLAQWQLGIDDRLFFQLGARVDRNSSFGEDAKWFFLPKAGVAWVVSEERFWREHLPSINTFRLRMAYGTTGRAPTPGASLETYAPAPFINNSGASSPGVVPLNPGNLHLKPERGTELEAGFDAGLFSDRVNVEATFYNKVTRDLLLQRPIPPSQGFTTDPFANIGKVLNRGIEATVHAQLMQRERVSWDAQLGLSTLHSEIQSLGDVAPFGVGFYGPINRFVVGRQPGAIFSQRIRRVDVANNQAIVSDTLEFVGNAMPTFEGNFLSGIVLFHTIRIQGQLDWKMGNVLHNNTADFRDRTIGVGEAVVMADELSPEERLRRFGPYVTESGAPASADLVREPYIQKADFLRLRELSVTWTLPARIAGRLAARRASLTLAGRNLALWTKYGGPDPEVTTYVAGTAGFADFFATDFLTVPQTRRFLARINVEF